MKKLEPFWAVWGIEFGPPTYRHASLESATLEAERLAKANPGSPFVILQSLVAVEVNNIHRTDLRPAASGDGELPF